METNIGKTKKFFFQSHEPSLVKCSLTRLGSTKLWPVLTSFFHNWEVYTSKFFIQNWNSIYIFNSFISVKWCDWWIKYRQSIKKKFFSCFLSTFMPDIEKTECFQSFFFTWHIFAKTFRTTISLSCKNSLRRKKCVFFSNQSKLTSLFLKVGPVQSRFFRLKPIQTRYWLFKKHNIQIHMS